MEKIGEFKPDNLIGGDMHRSTAEVILKAGQVYAVGSLLAITSTGVCVLVDSSTADKTVYGVLAHEVDATDSDTGAIAYLSGEFNQNTLVLGGSDTFDKYTDDARAKGIYFVDSSAPTTI